MELEQSKINKDSGSSYIQNKLIRKLAYFDMSSRESKIFHFIMGKTYCWNKDADDISLEQFVKGTGLAKTHVCDTLKILEKRQVIIRIKSGGYKADNFSINKNFDNWLTLIIKKKKFIPDIRNNYSRKREQSFPI